MRRLRLRAEVRRGRGEWKGVRRRYFTRLLRLHLSPTLLCCLLLPLRRRLRCASSARLECIDRRAATRLLILHTHAHQQEHQRNRGR